MCGETSILSFFGLFFKSLLKCLISCLDLFASHLEAVTRKRRGSRPGAGGWRQGRAS